MPKEDLTKKETKLREFKILRPGDEHLTTSLTGKPLSVVLKDKDRVITCGKDTAIVLEEWNGYLVVGGIRVEKPMQGIGTALYEEALKLAKAEGKKGLLSLPYERSPDAQRRWNRFKEQGRVTKVKINGDEYDAILC